MYQICVSGAAKGKSVKQGKELAHLTGRAIAKDGHVLMTGATSGLPDHAAHGAKKGGRGHFYFSFECFWKIEFFIFLKQVFLIKNNFLSKKDCNPRELSRNVTLEDSCIIAKIQRVS